MHELVHLAEETFHVAGEALTITGFVFVMMLVIEYINIRTKGRLATGLAKHGNGQYAGCTLLGVIPGCLGSFTTVSLYSHGIVSFGALVATMMATSGDAAFIMLARFPLQALGLFAILFVLGAVTGAVVDALFAKRRPAAPDQRQGYIVHDDDCWDSMSWAQVREQWRHCSLHRGVLVFFLGMFFLGVLTQEIGHYDAPWLWATVLASSLVALGVVARVPDHFLEEHLWNHVAKKHAARIFFWTLGALLLVHVGTEHFELENSIVGSRAGKALLLIVACTVGLIPDASPNFVFVLLFAEGTIPFSVLLANSIVQDGHGMLPMLAHSRRDFLAVKAINMVVGLVVGYTVLLAGF